MNAEEIRAAARAMMPHVIEDLRALVAHPSVSFPGFPSEPVRAAAEEAVRILRDCGFENARLVDVPDGYPAVCAEMPAPTGAPTVLLYGHYDVQPADTDVQRWDTDPWALTPGEDGRLYGRGAADNKSGIAIHAGATRVFSGKPPVGVKLVLEGEEETFSHLESFVEANPGLFEADVMVIADMGNIVVGEPAFTTSCRGTVACTIEVRTLDRAVHSGVFGGPAPDALVALVHILAALHDERGNTAVPELRSNEWEGAEFPEELFRAQSGMLPGVDAIGDGSIATQLWSKPSVTVLGLDAPRTEYAMGALVPVAKAHVSLRIAPGEDEKHALDALVAFLEAKAPWGVQVTIERLAASPAFSVATGGRALAAARQALADAYGVEPLEIGSGGTIPLLSLLSRAAPGAEFVLWGAEDMTDSRIHGGNESVDPTEIERMIVAEALLFQRLGEPPADAG